MKPVLAVHIHPESQVRDLEAVADQLNWYLDREYGPLMVSIRLIENAEDLRALMAGELVLYRKPARKVGNKIVYELDGVRHELEQLAAFGEQ